MIGNLSQNEVEELLHQQILGRIGCCISGQPYVVPISYAYDGKYIYCHSYEGKKVEMMRNNPEICFQVDETTDMSNWRSVIAWGKFEELVDEGQRTKALVLLLKRRLPVVSSITTHLGETWPFSGDNTDDLCQIPGIVFRIALSKKTGKFEKTSESPSLMFN